MFQNLILKTEDIVNSNDRGVHKGASVNGKEVLREQVPQLASRGREKYITRERRDGTGDMMPSLVVKNADMPEGV